MTEREALSLLLAMGHTVAMIGGRTVELSDLLDELTNEGPVAVVDFWPSHINLWRIEGINGISSTKKTLAAVITKSL